MSGGAYAASKFLITSTKQISPKVLKSLKGSNGKAGANGAAGPAGPAGAAGAGGAGPAGPQGPQGPGGASGAPGAAGKEGKEGKEGKTGFTETLPSGKTETGVWSARFTGELEGAKGEEENTQSTISFTIPLEAHLDADRVHYANTLVIQEKFGAGAGELCAGLTGTELSSCEANGRAIRTACPGSAADPTAEAGHLCLYEGEAESPKIAVPTILEPTSLATRGAGKAGAVAIVNYPGLPEESLQIVGAWAVTAP